MKRIFHVLLVLFIGVMLQSSPSPAANAEGPASTPEVTMRFSSDRILLGEPVWVLVTARNNSGVALEWNPGDYCYMDSQMPVTALGPEAAPGSGKPELCDYGGRGGDCFSGGSTTKIAPGQSATWKYLLEGNFHFTHARIYHLELTSHPGKIFRTVGDKTETAAAPAPIKQTLTLEVLSKNDAALLAREKQMAAGVEAEILTVKRAPAPDSEEERAAIWIQMQNVRQVRHGLASQPVSGMEPVFEHWLRLPNDFESDAIAGLKNLNTKDSRAALAELAKTPSKPNSSTQEGATRSLAEMGDRQYYPLMVQLLTSPDLNLRRAAIAGVGKLGGESGVAQLIEVLRTGSIVEQNDVLTALGNTNSRAAVKALIDLMGAKDAKGPVVAEWPLFVLTHHRLEQVTYRRTPAQTHEAWQQWWDAGGKNAPVHSPSECAQDAISHDAH